MALTIANVGARLGGRAVLTDVTATVAPGRVTVILGPNGAGKSTLLRAAAGLIPASGSIAVDGESIATLPPRERAQRIGYLPQDGGVGWNMRVAEVVALGRHPHATSPHENSVAVARALEATATTAFAERGIHALSGGERARVLLARVLAGEPRYLLADEPLAALDPAHQADIVARLRMVAAAGTGVAIVVHDLLQAQLAADDAILLGEGRVIAAGPAAQVLAPDHLQRVFGIGVAAIEAHGRTLWVPVGR